MASAGLTPLGSFEASLKFLALWLLELDTLFLCFSERLTGRPRSMIDASELVRLCRLCSSRRTPPLGDAPFVENAVKGVFGVAESDEVSVADGRLLFKDCFDALVFRKAGDFGGT